MGFGPLQFLMVPCEEKAAFLLKPWPWWTPTGFYVILPACRYWAFHQRLHLIFLGISMVVHRVHREFFWGFFASFLSEWWTFDESPVYRIDHKLDIHVCIICDCMNHLSAYLTRFNLKDSQKHFASIDPNPYSCICWLHINNQVKRHFDRIPIPPTLRIILVRFSG